MDDKMDMDDHTAIPTEAEPLGNKPEEEISPSQQFGQTEEETQDLSQSETLNEPDAELGLEQTQDNIIVIATEDNINGSTIVEKYSESDHGCISNPSEEVSPSQQPGEPGLKHIAKGAEFESFLELRDAIERYQKDNSMQLIVKDSKLLSAESTRKIIPKVYHQVNKLLMYHSITYCCKCHGELKQKPGTRVKNVGAKRLNCPMYLRLRLTSDLQRLVLFDIHEKHNHGIDPNTCQMAPRQQVYTLSRLRQGKLVGLDQGDSSRKPCKRRLDQNDSPLKRDLDTESDYSGLAGGRDVGSLIASAIKDVSSGSSYDSPTNKTSRLSGPDSTSQGDDTGLPGRPESPLDSESSFTDSDEEEINIQRRLLPFPIRLIGSAVRSSPELIAASKQLIELEKSKVMMQKHKLLLETKKLELSNRMLELEVKKMERSLVAEMTETEHGPDTTIYLHA